MAWLIMAVLLIAAALLVLSSLVREQRQQALVNRRLMQSRSDAVRPSARSNALFQRLSEQRWVVRLLNLDSETVLLLNRIGWRKTSQRSLFVVSQVGLPLLLLGMVLLARSLASEPSEPAWLWPVLALGGGYLIPKRLLAMVAGNRQRQLAKEVSTFIPLLRILFDAGLTVEQALRVLSDEGRKLMPYLTGEIRAVLRRVDSGLELADELKNLSKLLDVDDLSDCLVILQQLIRQGGGAMSSLLALKKLLDDRRLTALQEYISKLSAKLSVVMMVFLFPALLIVLAGPGMSAISRALGSMG